MLFGGTGETIYKCLRFSFFFFELQCVDHFCLKSFNLFSTEGLRGREQLRVREQFCPANKIA